jgi:hypothetical protein
MCLTVIGQHLQPLEITTFQSLLPVASRCHALTPVAGGVAAVEKDASINSIKSITDVICSNDVFDAKTAGRALVSRI